jgi:hypothetical protein
MGDFDIDQRVWIDRWESRVHYPGAILLRRLPRVEISSPFRAFFSSQGFEQRKPTSIHPLPFSPFV